MGPALRATVELRKDLPPEFMALAELASDLRWTWSHAGDELFRRIDADMWEASRNPWLVLRAAPAARLAELVQHPEFRAELERLVEERAEYVESAPAVTLDGMVAYFSMEYGLGAAIPLYAGGLGVLAGDYLKTASDLGLPLVGVGILYQEGYFRQTIDESGEQHEAYPYNDPSSLPIERAVGSDGAWVRVRIELPGRALWLRVFRARVGRVDLYLLDANDMENEPADRGITAKLYGGDREMRFLQEIVLGVGGPRALAALGVEFDVAHMNEGHSALVALERARAFACEQGGSFERALWATRAGNLFTTHTSVRAGLDSFPPELWQKYFPPEGSYLGDVGFAHEQVLGLGRTDPTDSREHFSMARFALRCSARSNAVSRVHQGVSRELFSDLFPRWPLDELPVDHVTNGVHASSWDSSAADELWTRTCGKGRWLGAVDSLQGAMECVSDEALWTLRNDARRELVLRARKRLRKQLSRRGSVLGASRASDVLDEHALTLGSGHRFAEYKRPNLLLANPERLTAIPCDPTRPVQLVVAGKAHPADEVGKRMLEEWMRFAARPEIRRRVVFLEDYDMSVAEEMVRGVDVWVNTPRRPWEACGTSGMKVLVNGGLNVSVLDGWWAEAWLPDVGWAVNEEPSDVAVADSLYRILEGDIVPEFYERDGRGIPGGWVRRMRASMSQLTPRFSSNRMVREYTESLYAPAARAHRSRNASDGALARDLVRFAERASTHFGGVHIGEASVQHVPEGFRIETIVQLGVLEPHEVRVELYAESRVPEDSPSISRMEPEKQLGRGAWVYAAAMETTRPETDFTVRARPFHPDATLPAELPRITWQR